MTSDNPAVPVPITAPAGAGAGKTTRDRLIEAAEPLFAEHGIAKASLRAITERAGANLASVHYHFGSKLDLVREVLARRLEPINAERLERLARAEAEGADLEDVIHAFVRPALRLVQEQPGGRDFARLVGRMISEPQPELRTIVLEQFRQVIERFTAAFSARLPHLPLQEIFWRFHFMVGTMLYTAGHGELIERYSEGACDAQDVDATTRRLVEFLAAGMRAESAATMELRR